MTPIESITLRILISLAIALVCAPIARVKHLAIRRNWKLYLASGFGICPSMPLVYLGSEYIPSGIVSVLFGLTPFFVGILSVVILKDRSMTSGRYLALSIAIAGLGFIFFDGKELAHNAYIGILLLLVAVAVFAVSIVFVKRYASDVHPLQQLIGSLTVASACLLIWWVLFDRDMPNEFTTKSLLALMYLSSFGSVLGFIGYFYLIQRISVNLVTLVPLITPALAIWLGYVLNDESLTIQLLIGSGLVLAGLALFNWFRPKI